MDNNAFVFYKNWYEGIERIPQGLQTQAFNMIARYGLYGEEPSEDTNWALRASFYGCVKQTIDCNNDKHEGICMRRREAGKRGGICRGAVRRTKQNEAFDSKCKQMQAKLTKQGYNEGYLYF